MFEEAFKKVPTNEDMGAQTFFANIRTANWKSGQQVSNNVRDEVFIYLNSRLGMSGCNTNVQAISRRPLPLLEHYVCRSSGVQ